MHISKLTTVAAILLAGLSWTEPAAASCECGYLVTRGSEASVLFTTKILTDFTDPNLSDLGSDWFRTTDAIAGTAPALNRKMTVDNIYKDSQGLVIRTPAYSGSGPVLGGQLQTMRVDIKYGSFRARMKTSSVQGVCQSLFFYKDDNSEIDIEFLTGPANQDGTPRSLHFTNQKGTTIAPDAGFDPAADFHQYRIDWIPGKTQMYVDGTLRATHTTNVPTVPGEILINSWSNGDPRWSQGPPTADALLRVKTVALYFNHTNAAENAAFNTRCAQATGSSKVCTVA